MASHVSTARQTAQNTAKRYSEPLPSDYAHNISDI